MRIFGYMGMMKELNKIGKFVRLNLVREIVEVVSVDSTGITVKFYGKKLTMEHREVSLVTPEEVAVAERRFSH
jgi:hypothetical protein